MVFFLFFRMKDDESKLQSSIVNDIKQLLDMCNPFVKTYIDLFEIG